MPWRRSKVNEHEAAKLYNSGWTLERLGEKYGVTRERVRQKITSLVDHERPRAVKCSCCGKEFTCPSNSRNTTLCSAECREIRKRQYFERSHLDQCKCGRMKYRVSKVCMNCTRTFDHGLAAHLYDSGASGLQIAKFMGVRSITVYKAIEKMCVSHGTRFRSELDDADLKRLAKEYLEE